MKKKDFQINNNGKYFNFILLFQKIIVFINYNFYNMFFYYYYYCVGCAPHFSLVVVAYFCHTSAIPIPMQSVFKFII